MRIDIFTSADRFWEALAICLCGLCLFWCCSGGCEKPPPPPPPPPKTQKKPVAPPPDFGIRYIDVPSQEVPAKKS